MRKRIDKSKVIFNWDSSFRLIFIDINKPKKIEFEILFTDARSNEVKIEGKWMV